MPGSFQSRAKIPVGNLRKDQETHVDTLETASGANFWSHCLTSHLAVWRFQKVDRRLSVSHEYRGCSLELVRFDPTARRVLRTGL